MVGVGEDKEQGFKGRVDELGLYMERFFDSSRMLSAQK